MTSRMWFSRISLGIGFGASLAIMGCGNVPGTGGVTAGLALKGGVHGGQQPLVGAQVDLFAAGTSGYGVGAVSLLTGGPVLTDSNGSFTITSGYSCPTSNTQVYVTATGGNPGAGINSKSVMMAALGSCGNLRPSTFISINEVSTVASAFSLAQFMSPGSTAVGTSATNSTGLLNAFNTVSNLMDLTTGLSRSLTPNGNGAVSQTKINSLANIVAACINSTGSTGPCLNLFAAATPPGGTAPTDTLSALINIALYPGNNVATLFNLPAPQSPFQPTLSGTPNDWTLSVAYTGGGLNAPLLPAIDASGSVWVPNGASTPGTLSMFTSTGVETTITGGGLSLPFGAAVDVSGNVWTINSGNNTVSEHTSNGTPLSGSGFTAVGLAAPEAIALDAAGHVFVADANNSVTELTSAGAPLAQFSNGGLNIPYGIAVDTSQNIWTANSAGNTVSKFNTAGVSASISGFTGGGLARPYWVAIDALGSAWVPNFNNASVSKFDSAGNPLSGSGFAAPSGVTALAIDGGNTVWLADRNGSIAHLSNAGAALSPASGYTATGAVSESGIVIDGSGNIWVTDNGADTLFEYVGAASPVVVPLQRAVLNGQLGQRP